VRKSYKNLPKKGKLRCAAVKITLKKISVENIDVEFSPGTIYEELENFKQLSPPVQLRNISWSQNSPEKILTKFEVKIKYVFKNVDERISPAVTASVRKINFRF